MSLFVLCFFAVARVFRPGRVEHGIKIGAWPTPDQSSTTYRPPDMTLDPTPQFVCGRRVIDIGFELAGSGPNSST
jgi:hypothetical protein